MTIIGILHLDMHMGNIGVRDNKVVIYDFGQMKDVRKLDKRMREEFVRHKVNCDTDKYIRCFFHDKSIAEQLIRVSGEGSTYERLMRAFKYTCANNIEIDTNIRAILLSHLKTISFVYVQECIIKENPEYIVGNLYKNGIRQYIQTYLPYGEFKELAPLFD